MSTHSIDSRQQRVLRVQRCLQESGVVYELRELDLNTATAKMAAAALSCQVAEIAKSIVFCRRQDKFPIVVILCGDQRVDIKKLSTVVSDEVDKANADYVNLHCGFELGGVAPLAHRQETLILMDEGLCRFDKIWAAAGSAYCVFGIAPKDLAHAANARIINIAEG